jgi:hypothetical protein
MYVTGCTKHPSSNPAQSNHNAAIVLPLAKVLYVNERRMPRNNAEKQGVGVWITFQWLSKDATLFRLGLGLPSVVRYYPSLSKVP